MGSNGRYYQYLFDNRAAVATHVEDSRKLVENLKELLNGFTVDTFLGRKTQEPFPKEPFSKGTERL